MSTEHTADAGVAMSLSKGHSAEKDVPAYTQEDMAEAWRAGAQEGFGAPSDWRLGQVYALNSYVTSPGKCDSDG